MDIQKKHKPKQLFYWEMRYSQEKSTKNNISKAVAELQKLLNGIEE